MAALRQGFLRVFKQQLQTAICRTILKRLFLVNYSLKLKSIIFDEKYDGSKIRNKMPVHSMQKRINQYKTDPFLMTTLVKKSKHILGRNSQKAIKFFFSNGLFTRKKKRKDLVPFHDACVICSKEPIR